MKSTRLPQLFPLLALLFLLLSACRPTASIAKSGLQRNTLLNVQSEDFDSLTDENNAFALDLYQSLRARDGNLVYSPYSISLALAMTYAGARGETEAQMAQTLHFLPKHKLHAALNALDLELAKRGAADSNDATPFQLNIANAVWAEQTFPFLQTYLDVLAQNYGAGIQLADFINQYETVRKEINSWVNHETNDKIHDLLPEGVLKPSTRMVLVNAIYFKADWRTPFDPNNTYEAPFHLLDSSAVQVNMMSESLSAVPYAQGDGYQAISLPYQGDTADMVIIVPEEGRFEEFESTLDAQKLNEILGSMQPGGGLQLELPKFSFPTDFSLKEQLMALGMSNAFDPDRADFSGMTGKRDLYIDNILHKAFVAVDEKGTEAAAATAVIMDLTSIMLPDVTLTVDRPFIFLIRDLHSGQVLFVGRVLNPAE
jgi:serpin B